MAIPIERIKSLIDRAVHPSTTENEARTSALLAVKLIKKHELHIVESEPEIQSEQIGYPINPDDFMQEVQTFNVVINKVSAICAACKKEVRKDIPIAHNFATDEKTHFECKRYFIGRRGK